MHQPTGDNYALDADGNRVFTEGPPPTTVDAGIMNSTVYEIINAIIASGQTLAEGPGTDLKNQLATAIQRAAAYDAIVYSQETFNAIWERVAANEYKIKDGIGAVYFKAYSGGYNMSGPSSPLSGGDTWGRFKTNACTFIMCDGGNVFQMGDTPSYWEISSSNTVVYNMDVQGIGTVAAAVEKSIYIAATAENCKLLFCSSSSRKSNTNMKLFQDDSALSTVLNGAVTDVSSTGEIICYYGFAQAIACRAYSITTDGIFQGVAWVTAKNVVGCDIFDITATGICYGFNDITNISNCRVYNMTGTVTVRAFTTSKNVSGCIADTVTSTTDEARGFSSSSCVSGCTAQAVLSQAKSAYGFYDCDNVSGCRAYDIETSVASASYKAVGFQDCNQLSACEANTIAASAANAYAYGFHNCDRITACYAVTVTAVTASRTYGFYDCDWMDGSCHAASIDDVTFYDCSNKPFKSNNQDVYTAQSYSGSTSMVTYSPTKDGIIYGFVRIPSGGAYVYLKEGGAATDYSNADIAMHVDSSSYPHFVPFSMPVYAGNSYVFSKNVTTAVHLTLRFMPFGTTT